MVASNSFSLLHNDRKKRATFFERDKTYLSRQREPSKNKVDVFSFAALVCATINVQLNTAWICTEKKLNH